MAETKSWTKDDMPRALEWVRREAKAGREFRAAPVNLVEALQELAAITEPQNLAQALRLELTEDAWLRLAAPFGRTNARPRCRGACQRSWWRDGSPVARHSRVGRNQSRERLPRQALARRIDPLAGTCSCSPQTASVVIHRRSADRKPL